MTQQCNKGNPYTVKSIIIQVFSDIFKNVLLKMCLEGVFINNILRIITSPFRFKPGTLFDVLHTHIYIFHIHFIYTANFVQQSEYQITYETFSPFDEFIVFGYL